MIELIFSIIFVVSLGGILFFLVGKIPVLNALPQNGTTGIKKHKIILDAETKVKEILVYFEKQILLHKFLSWVKCLVLKTEVQLDRLLHNIRKKAQKTDKK